MKFATSKKNKFKKNFLKKSEGEELFPYLIKPGNYIKYVLMYFIIPFHSR